MYDIMSKTYIFKHYHLNTLDTMLNIPDITSDNTTYDLQPTHVPLVEQSLPSVEQSLPSVEQSLPLVEQSLPLVEQSLPLVEQSLPLVEQSLPSTDERMSTILNIRHKMGFNIDHEMLNTNNIYTVNNIVKGYLRELYEETMFKNKHMSSNISILFNPTNGHLTIEYIGYKGTDFHNGQYFILFELPYNYPNSPPKISVLTESGRFIVKAHLSLSITQYHRELWYPMPLIFLIINMLSVFPDYSIMGIGHMFKKNDETSLKIKELAEKTREYNKLHYGIMYDSFKTINKLKESGSDTEIQSFIDESLNSY